MFYSYEMIPIKIKHILLALAFLSPFFSGASVAETNFLTEQMQYPRVREALNAKGDSVRRLLAEHGLKKDALNILFVAYKAAKSLEIHAKAPQETKYRKIAEYPICAASGTLGPKRQQGDRQVPEGFYKIDRFNPKSGYYLSLGVSYPNTADKIKSTATDLGGDIFIHGDCVSIGCLAMTDDKIKEIYLLAVYARASGQMEIPVYIFPFKLTEENMNVYSTSKIVKSNFGLNEFWGNLQKGYVMFNQSGEAVRVAVDNKGDYQFKR